MPDRLIQSLALALALLGSAVSGALLPGLNEQSDRHALRYTDTTVEGAPAFVALGTAIGALRGLIVDYLWIKIHIMKERGLFYEVMADAELITKLQPRFAAVWAFQGHNMAYNISVATHTQRERWEWVQAGIRLVRNEGLRYNPNDLILHKELAFWFAHKIEGVADDAHLFYKTEFAREWHYLLGEPPDDWRRDPETGQGVGERVEWIRAVAEAPATLEAAVQRTPGVADLVAELERIHAEHGRPFTIDRAFVTAWGEWNAVRNESAAAALLGTADEAREKRAFFRAFDDLARDPDRQEAWRTLVLHARKRALLDDYNMEPQRMLRYTVELGPIDWRHAQAHALYWSRRGSELAEHRVFDPNDAYKVLNNDRIQLQAMQGLARYGRIWFDPMSRELPARFPDPRWIDTVELEFERLYVKNYDTRGGGPESFIGFLQNFLGSAVREWYRAGEIEKAQQLMDRLDALFGSGQREDMRTWEYGQDLETFVWRQALGEYEFQPHLAPSDVAASLRYGIVQGLGRGDMELMRNAIVFANKVTELFTGNRYNDYVNKFGRGRMSELISALQDSILVVFAQVMVDRSIPLEHRLSIWSRADEADPRLRGWAYDKIRPALERELASSVWGEKYTIDQVIPAPPNLQEMRAWIAERERARAAEREEQNRRDEIEAVTGGR